jgi:hypothetical protein
MIRGDPVPVLLVPPIQRGDRTRREVDPRACADIVDKMSKTIIKQMQ